MQCALTSSPCEASRRSTSAVNSALDVLPKRKGLQFFLTDARPLLSC